MQQYIAYGCVVFLWSTTPLAIHWSNTDLSYSAAALLRMAIAFVVAYCVLVLQGKSLPVNKHAVKVYFAAGLSIFPGMPLVYWSAQYISSGLIAIIFGLMPFVIGVLSLIMYRENTFNRFRIFAASLAAIGLGLIYRDQLQLAEGAEIGVMGVLISTIVFAFSGLWLKKINDGVNAFEQTTGALGMSLPGLITMWIVLDGTVPNTIGERSVIGVGYLAIMGSVLGFTLYYYILQRFSAESVSLITLMSPIIAVTIGVVFVGEAMSSNMLFGAGCVIGALIFYQHKTYIEPVVKVVRNHCFPISR